MGSPAQEHPFNFNQVNFGVNANLAGFEAVVAGKSSATGSGPAGTGPRESKKALGQGQPGHNSSSQFVRTQSQEYLRSFHQENKSLQPQATHAQGRRHVQHGRGGGVAYGGSIINKNGGMLSIYKT